MIRFYEDAGVWWPDSEGDGAAHYVKNARVKDCEWATKRCKKARTVVQAGGYIGLWPKKLASLFDRVITFEPVDELAYCVRKNTEGLGNIELHQRALIAALKPDQPLTETAFTWAPHGRSGVRNSPSETCVVATTIDALELRDVDLIYLDLEGGEGAALEGATQTIARCSPTIVVEINPPYKDITPKVLNRLGYEFECKAHTDHLFKRRPR